MFTGDRNTADGLTSEDFTRPGIPFKTFVDRYLSHGEVKRIVFVPANTRAIAILHSGAVIDGKPASEQSVIVEYPQNAQQFWAEIRKVEAEMGIGLAQGVQIDLYQGMTTIKVIELLIGVVILAWLGTQYGRLLRKRLLENQAKKGGKL
uniref:PBPe domain-containing protein n=1 Tax=Caenorhabditis tropicalis TaxID=1561998 RepID=A0A1I7T1W0_9PELO